MTNAYGIGCLALGRFEHLHRRRPGAGFAGRFRRAALSESRRRRFEMESSPAGRSLRRLRPSKRKSSWWAVNKSALIGWRTAKRRGTAARWLCPTAHLPSGRGFLSDEKYYLPLEFRRSGGDRLERGKDRAHFQVAKRRHSGQFGVLQGPHPFAKLSRFGGVLSTRCRRGRSRRPLLPPIPAMPRRSACAAKSCWTPAIAREAVECYRKAYEIAAEPRTKLLLRDSLLDGLRTGIRQPIVPAKRGNRKTAGKFSATGGLSATDDRRLAKCGRNSSRLSTNANC